MLLAGYGRGVRSRTVCCLTRDLSVERDMFQSCPISLYIRILVIYDIYLWILCHGKPISMCVCVGGGSNIRKSHFIGDVAYEASSSLF